jgi:hypothetical protein
LGIEVPSPSKFKLEHDVDNEFLEPELDNWLAKPQSSGLIRNRPIPLLIVCIISVILLAMIYPKAEFYLKPVEDCGDITVRPEVAPDQRIPLNHNTFCKMTGTVADLRVFTSGGDHLDGPEYEKGVLPPQSAFEDVRYFSKLTGDKVFVMLDAAADDVYAYRRKHEGDALFGFGVDHVGRVIDPAKASSSLRKIGHFMRRQFIVPGNRPIRLFDTTDTPAQHLSHFIAMLIALVGFLLSGYGLIRLLRKRRL